MENTKEKRPLGCVIGVIGFWVIILSFILTIVLKDDFMWVLYTGIGMAAIGFIKMQMMNNSEDNERLKSLGIESSQLLFAGKYVCGHPEIDSDISPIKLSIDKTAIRILNKEQHSDITKILGLIYLDRITNVTVENETTIESRVGVRRLLAIGLFAFAFKKKVRNEIAYLVIEWSDRRFTHETIFELEGRGSLSTFNTIRNKILKEIK